MVVAPPFGKQTIRKHIWVSLCERSNLPPPDSIYFISTSGPGERRDYSGKKSIAEKEKKSTAELGERSAKPLNSIFLFPDHISVRAAGLDKALWLRC